MTCISTKPYQTYFVHIFEKKTLLQAHEHNWNNYSRTPTHQGLILIYGHNYKKSNYWQIFELIEIIRVFCPRDELL